VPRKDAPLTAFACYRRPVLAPADGTIVRVNGDARDWPTYRKGADPGNYVNAEAPTTPGTPATESRSRTSFFARCDDEGRSQPLDRHLRKHDVLLGHHGVADLILRRRR
jgi:hypothetical protein